MVPGLEQGRRIRSAQRLLEQRSDRPGGREEEPAAIVRPDGGRLGVEVNVSRDSLGFSETSPPATSPDQPLPARLLLTTAARVSLGSRSQPAVSTWFTGAARIYLDDRTTWSWRSSWPLNTRTPLVETEKKAPSRNEPTGSATRTASPDSCRRWIEGLREQRRVPDKEQAADARRDVGDVGSTKARGQDTRGGRLLGLAHRAPARHTGHLRCTPRNAQVRERKCLPSGRKDGRRCVLSPREESTCVTTDAGPPEAAHRMRPPFAFPTMITSPRFHAPPTANSGRSHTFCGAPPRTSIFFELSAGVVGDEPAVRRPEHGRRHAAEPLPFLTMVVVPVRPCSGSISARCRLRPRRRTRGVDRRERARKRRPQTGGSQYQSAHGLAWISVSSAAGEQAPMPGQWRRTSPPMNQAAAARRERRDWRDDRAPGSELISSTREPFPVWSGERASAASPLPAALTGRTTQVDDHLPRRLVAFGRILLECFFNDHSQPHGDFSGQRLRRAVNNPLQFLEIGLRGERSLPGKQLVQDHRRKRCRCERRPGSPMPAPAT